MEELKRLLFRLCSAPGTSGAEESAAETAVRELEKYGTTRVEGAMSNVVCTMGNPDARRRILLDAHLDQIGLVVTGVDERGFVRVAPCGGVDRRVLPGSPMTVCGRETLRGVVSCMPPHLLEGGEDKVVPVEKMAVDLGLPRDRVMELVAPGDRVLWQVQPRALLGSRVTAAGLDDRAGVCVLIRCAELLIREKLDCRLSILLSSREEVGGQGAVTGAFAQEPDEALVVDVSFGTQPGVAEQKSGRLSGGPMIGVAPSLNHAMTQELARLARKQEIPFQYEVMGGKTGTNADSIGISRAGVRCALASVPLRNMHTPAEVVDLTDLENTARLLAEYVKEAR